MSPCLDWVKYSYVTLLFGTSDAVFAYKDRLFTTAPVVATTVPDNMCLAISTHFSEMISPVHIYQILLQ